MIGSLGMLNTKIRVRGSCERMRRDHVEAAEAAALHGEIDDDDVGMVAAVKAITRGRAARFEHASASLQHDRMIVDDQDTGHWPPSRDVITVRMRGPRPLAVWPPSPCTRICAAAPVVTHGE